MVTTSQRSGNFGDVMKEECAAHEMEPVCDHFGYCESAAGVLYLGQGSNHLSQYNARAVEDKWPSGWAPDMARKWDSDMCMWTGKGSADKALCDDGQGSHYWSTLEKGPYSFMCGRLLPYMFKVGLAGTNFQHRGRAGCFPPDLQEHLRGPSQ